MRGKLFDWYAARRQPSIVLCRDCGTAWLFGKRRWLGLCTRCEQGRQDQDKLANRVKELYPACNLAWLKDNCLSISLEREGETITHVLTQEAILHLRDLAGYLANLFGRP